MKVTTKKINKVYILDSSVFLLVLIIFAISITVLGKAVQNYSDTQNNINNTNLTNQINDDVISKFQKIDLTKNNFSDSLPSQITVVNWVEQLETIAGDIGVKETVTFTNAELTKDNILVPAQVSGNTPFLNANLTITGKYNQVLAFIDMLNHSYYYTRIDAVTFSATKSTNGSNATGTIPTPTPTANISQTVTSTITIDLFVKDLAKQTS